jgi:hypothetical protein
MARLGAFDPQLTSQAWFNTYSLPEGWFADELIPESTPSGSYTLSVDSASYTVAFQTFAFAKNSIISIDTASYAVSAQDVTLTYTPVGSFTLTVDPAAYAVAAQDVTLTYAPVINRTLTIDTAAYTVAFQTASLIWSGAPSPTVELTAIIELRSFTERRRI